MTGPAKGTIIPALPSVQNIDSVCFHDVIPSRTQISFLVLEVFFVFFSTIQLFQGHDSDASSPEIPEIHHWHVPVCPFIHPAWGNWCQSTVCGSACRSLSHWFQAVGQSIFRSTRLSSYGYSKLKWTLGGINIIWKGERDSWQLTRGCGAAGGGSVSSVFPAVL